MHKFNITKTAINQLYLPRSCSKLKSSASVLELNIAQRRWNGLCSSLRQVLSLPCILLRCSGVWVDLIRFLRRWSAALLVRCSRSTFGVLLRPSCRTSSRSICSSWVSGLITLRVGCLEERGSWVDGPLRTRRKWISSIGCTKQRKLLCIVKPRRLIRALALSELLELLDHVIETARVLITSVCVIAALTLSRVQARTLLR